MHTTFQLGWMSNALWLIARETSRSKSGNDSCEDFVRYVSSFQFPLNNSSVRGKLKRLFDPIMIRKHRSKRCIVGNASLQFSLYPLLRAYALTEFMTADHPDLLRHVAVYDAACEVVDIIKLVKYQNLSMQEARLMLLTAYAKWFDLQKCNTAFNSSRLSMSGCALSPTALHKQSGYSICFALKGSTNG